MWNDESGYQDGGGGFDNTTNMFTSPAPAGTGKSGSKHRALAPVTIKQILESSEEGLVIHGIDVQVVKVVGIIRAIEKSTIKVSYEIEDCTGLIQGVSYLETDTDVPEPVIEDTYCVVIGTVRSQGGSKHIMIFNIYPVIDFNEIMEHYLSVIHMTLKAETMSAIKIEQPTIKQEMQSSYGTSGNMANDINYEIDSRYRGVYEIIFRSESESGISMGEILSKMQGKMAQQQIKNALEYLVGEGHIFTTIDENHFKSTESPF